MSSVVIAGNTSGSITISAPDVSGSNTLTLPVATDTLVGKATTDTLTNKTLVNPTITGLQTLNTPNTFGFKNRIINGGMVIDQRNAGASVTISAAGTASGFVVDRFNFQNNITSGTMTVQKSNTAPSGFSNSVLITNGAAVTAASGDGARFWQPIEGFNFADMNFGSVSAQIVTLSFWVRSSLTGTYAGGLVNSATNRSYVFTYTVSSANTWEQKTVTIAGDTSGTWVGATNGVGAYLFLDLGSGSALNGTAGTWNASYANRTSGSINWVGTSGATFYITGVQLEKGSTATSFDFRDYGRELAMCQRYMIKYLGNSVFEKLPLSGWSNSSINFIGSFCLPVVMRASPSLTYSALGVATGGNAVSAVTVDQLSTISPSFNFATTGLTLGYAQVVQANNSTAAFVILSSEL